ncbi:MAG TPA: ferrochelatase [Dermatophilaceae bacterium]|nr:ferrochelatase [Dermatophilaceae bacterium]
MTTTDRPVRDAPAPALDPYQAILLLSFGGPERPEEVMPFLRRVTAGRGIPDERLAAVAEHYHAVGGRSPINDQNRALLAALRAELDRRGIPTPLVWGNRNSAPFLADALRDAHDGGLTRLVTVVTSAYSSYSSCRQYRENLAAAAAELELEGRHVQLDKVRVYANHPGFARANLRLLTDAVRDDDRLRDLPDDQVRLVFVTHSIPEAMDQTSGPGEQEGSLYHRQHQALADALAAEVNTTLDRSLKHAVAFCSRSGPPSQPWLEPDVNDHLKELAGEGVQAVVVAPVGFVSDHMEVVFDLDTEAAASAAELGLLLVRVPTVGTDPQFVSGLVDLVQERAAQARGEQVAASAWPWPEPMWSVCPRGCCPNLRTAAAALCGSDR